MELENLNESGCSNIGGENKMHRDWKIVNYFLMFAIINILYRVWFIFFKCECYAETRLYKFGQEYNQEINWEIIVLFYARDKCNFDYIDIFILIQFTQLDTV